MRATNIVGVRVVSEIEDVVIDLDNGTIAYAVLHYHTWFRDKLFAIPWSELSLIHDDSGRYFVLDTTRDTLNSAPGFNPQNWPDNAADVWRDEVDDHYREN